ncbi:MAG: SDR family NAD(P)-dependent oxidoreductase [Acidimicrobiales bacterium]
MEQLEGRTAVVTGAASGMGRAFARRFAKAGMNVVLSDVEEPVLDEAVTEVAAIAADRNAEAIGVITDVADERAVAELADRSIEHFGTVNVVCNNAGVAGTGLVDGPGSISTKDWKWVLDVNLWGVIHGHQAFLPHLLDHGDGHIVNTASMAGHFPGHSAYTASKWAVVGITEGLFTQLKTIGSTVGVSCLCPGWVNTNIAESARNRPEWAAPDALAEPSPQVEARFAMIRDQLASGRSPDEVADLVHDAVIDDSFWIFTDLSMVANLRPRFDAVLANRNPDWTRGFLGDDDE